MEEEDFQRIVTQGCSLELNDSPEKGEMAKKYTVGDIEGNLCTLQTLHQSSGTLRLSVCLSVCLSHDEGVAGGLQGGVPDGRTDGRGVGEQDGLME